MNKVVCRFLALVLFLNVGFVFAQDAAPAAEAEVVATQAVDLTTMSFDDMVNYLASLSPEEFADVVVNVVNSGDRYLARRVVSAANQVLANAGEKAADLVTALNARGSNVLAVQNGNIKVVAPQTSTLMQKFDVPSAVENSTSLPPATPEEEEEPEPGPVPPVSAGAIVR